MSPSSIRLGMLTPSSNTVLEPVTARMLAGTPVTAHFARFPVTEIALDPAALAQFDHTPMLEAARLLSHARVHAIAWNGTSAAWLGLESDRRLCAAINEATGIPAATSVLGLVEAFRLGGIGRFGLVTPYTPDVQEAIVRNLEAEGLTCVAERHAGIRDNFAFAALPAADLAGMIRAVAAEGPEAITVLCTNLAGAPLVEALESELGLPIHDSVATTVWHALRAAGAEVRIEGFGTLLRG